MGARGLIGRGGVGVRLLHQPADPAPAAKRIAGAAALLEIASR
ncbi:MAG: hypothetical protein ACRDWW_04505 [Acidimicrobiales bacterium]